MVTVLDRTRMLLRASDGALPVAAQTLLRDLAAELDRVNGDLNALTLAFAAHLADCPQAPVARAKVIALNGEVQA